MPYPNEPDHSSLGARLRERTQPLAPDDAQYGYAHAWLAEALSRTLLQVQEVFDPEDPIPPIAPLLDPELCPDWALPWLAQMVGIRLPEGTSADQARALIVAVAGFQRGTPAAMRAAIEYTLTGAKTVYFRERNGSAYRLEVVTLDPETPDPNATLAAINSQKPGGIVLVYRHIVGWDYEAMTTAGGTYLTLATTYTSYRTLTEHTPG